MKSLLTLGALLVTMTSNSMTVSEWEKTYAEIEELNHVQKKPPARNKTSQAETDSEERPEPPIGLASQVLALISSHIRAKL